MYESPIEMIQTHMQNQIDKDVLKILMNYDIKVDKNELIRALQYDRNQYEKGYADAKAELVRCKDCKYWTEERDIGMFCNHWGSMLAETHGDDYCSCGERKEDEANGREANVCKDDH